MVMAKISSNMLVNLHNNTLGVCVELIYIFIKIYYLLNKTKSNL